MSAKRAASQQREFFGWPNRDLSANERLSTNLLTCVYETKFLERLRSMISQWPEDSREGFVAEMPKCWTGYPPFGPIEPATAKAVKFKYRRSVNPKGPLAVFGYDYFVEHAKAAGITIPKLLTYEGSWGSGEEYAYEVLNFADGNHSESGIWDAVSAEYGPVPLEMVVEYLKALEKIGLVEQVK